ncbi:MAG: hypothetical protein L0287_01730, partial [Anaerolineae bacterium]|nr:hypothetical protein [Anaerolineae bacterium]
VISGDDQGRYHHLVMSLDAVRVPRGSAYAHATSCNPARNTNNLVNMLLANPDYQWLWIMGDDHCFNDDMVLNLLAHKKDCVMPLCSRRMFPWDPIYMKIFQPDLGQWAWYTWEEIEKEDDLFKIAAGGNAGLLVQRPVFEALPRPWFQIGRWQPDDLQEDIYFTYMAKRAGYPVWVDKTQVLGHITNSVMFPKIIDGKIGVAGNIGGYKMLVVPPGWTAKRNEQGEHVISKPIGDAPGSSF